MISETLELDPSSSLFAASEMFKNLFDMSTDSFSARSGTYNPPDLIGGGVFPHSNFPVPHIYHSGAMTAMVDLFPAVCDTKTCNGATEETTVSEVSALLTLFCDLCLRFSFACFFVNWIGVSKSEILLGLKVLKLLFSQF